MNHKPGKTILLTGGTGLVGQELGLALVQRGYKLRLLVREPEHYKGLLPFPAELIRWDAKTLEFSETALQGCDAVINLAGDPIMEGRWSQGKKSSIVSSRVDTTKALVQKILSCPQKPGVFVQASAVGYYGSRGDELLSETSAAGDAKNFLVDVCRKWEAAAHPIAEAGMRTVTMRIGMVLALTGGALPQLATAYTAGLGSNIGAGRQWLSWIHIEDLVGLMLHAIDDQRYHGVYNATAPQACLYRDFHAALRQTFKVKGLPPAPPAVIKLALGEKAQIILDSQRVQPARALAERFVFKHPDITSALGSLYSDAIDPQAQWLIARQWVASTEETVWQFFASEKNLERLTPDFLHFRVLDKDSSELGEGTRITYTLKLRGLPMRWRSLISAWRPPHGFVDSQEKGPYALWHHTHSFVPLAGGMLLQDTVQYKLPMSPCSKLLVGRLVDADLKRIFDYRRHVIAKIF